MSGYNLLKLWLTVHQNLYESYSRYHGLISVCTQWRYCVRLENIGEETVQLRERHWRIFSLSGTLETVRGRGVVGQVMFAFCFNWNAMGVFVFDAIM